MWSSNVWKRDRGCGVEMKLGINLCSLENLVVSLMRSGVKIFKFYKKMIFLWYFVHKSPYIIVLYIIVTGLILTTLKESGLNHPYQEIIGLVGLLVRSMTYFFGCF